MRAAIVRGGDIVVDTLPAPVPGVGQVLVKTLACGICGSDLHAAKHAHRRRGRPTRGTHRRHTLLRRLYLGFDRLKTRSHLRGVNLSHDFQRR